MKSIFMENGQTIFVDEDVYEWASQFPWHIVSHGYAGYSLPKNLRNKFGQQLLLHRLIVKCPKNKMIDHINGNKLDNRRENLRVCTNSQNQMNRNPKRNGIGFKGVFFDKERHKWRARININGKDTMLGRYNSPEEAAKAYDNEARKHFGEFAKTNF